MPSHTHLEFLPTDIIGAQPAAASPNEDLKSMYPYEMLEWMLWGENFNDLSSSAIKNGLPDPVESMVKEIKGK